MKLKSLFLKYTPIKPYKRTEPFRMSAIGEVLCPDEIKKGFSDFTHMTTYRFNKNVIRFFHEDEDCDVKVHHIARFLSGIQTKPVVADIFFTPYKKFYPENRIFGWPHLNSGYYKDSRIVIFRREEWFKVFIHECMHYFHFEHALDQVYPEILTLFHKSNVDIFETYCELCARNLHCAYLSSITHIPESCIYEIERNHSIQLMVDVLHHMKLEYNDLFNPHEYKEDTNIFAYVVLTAILMFSRYKPHYDPTTKFELKSDREFVDAILKGAKDSEFFKDVHAREPSALTTMTKLSLDEFISHL